MSVSFTLQYPWPKSYSLGKHTTNTGMNQNWTQKWRLAKQSFIKFANRASTHFFNWFIIITGKQKTRGQKILGTLFCMTKRRDKIWSDRVESFIRKCTIYLWIMGLRLQRGDEMKPGFKLKSINWLPAFNLFTSWLSHKWVPGIWLDGGKILHIISL